MCFTVTNFIKIGRTVAEIWRFNGFQNSGRPPSSLFKFKSLTVGAVNGPTLHHRTKFSGKWSSR